MENTNIDKYGSVSQKRLESSVMLVYTNVI